MNLDDQQKEAVISTSRETVILAGPGSGKTTTVAERIAHLVQTGLDPSRIIALSFSNAAANELRSRLNKLIIEIAFVGTLHAYCMRTMRAHGHLIGYRKGGPTIAQPALAREVLLECRRRLGWEKKVTEKAIEEARNREAIQIKEEYHRTLKRQNMIDYDGILSEAALLLQIPAARPKLEAVVVDEAQDSELLDWVIYDGLAGQKTFVGDTDQSCYGFRGARPELLLHRMQRDEVGKFFLERNYRSDVLICQAANTLIAHNTNRPGKVINPNSNELGEVEVIEFSSSREEAMQIAKQVYMEIRDGVSPKEIAVLARYNAQVDDIRHTLVEMCIPVAARQAVDLPKDWDFCLTAIQLMVDRANNLLAERYLLGIQISLTQVNRWKMESMKTGKTIAQLAELPQWKTDLEALPNQLVEAGVDGPSVALVMERINALPAAHPTLSDLLADLWRPDDWSREGKTEGVTCSTIHGAKGREWDIVFVAGCEEGILPGGTQLSKFIQILEEERRLMFIAITRARHRLVLTYCEHRFIWGKMREQTPSRFLSEINLNFKA